MRRSSSVRLRQIPYPSSRDTAHAEVSTDVVHATAAENRYMRSSKRRSFGPRRHHLIRRSRTLLQSANGCPKPNPFGHSGIAMSENKAYGYSDMGYNSDIHSGHIDCRTCHVPLHTPESAHSIRPQPTNFAKSRQRASQSTNAASLLKASLEV